MGGLKDLKKKIIVIQGDITDIQADAIVNAANTDLILGAGVAGAIRRKGGESIQEECRKIGPISLGEAALTRGGSLKAKYVIHAAGMHLGGRVGEHSLKNTTKNSLRRADEKGIKTIAFPAIGTGIGGLPTGRGAEIMIDLALSHLESRKTSIEKVYFVLFDEHTFRVFKEYLDKR